MIGLPIAGLVESVKAAPISRRSGVVAAMLRRDLGQGRLLGLPILLDIVYGAANLLVFLFISRVLHHSGQQGLGQSVTYFDYVAVGLAFMVVAQVACVQIATRVQEEQRSGTLEALVGAPVSRGSIALGIAAYPIVVGVLRSAVYLALACLLMGVDSASASWPGVTLILVIGGVAIAALGLCIGAFAVAFSHGPAAARALVVLLGFLSGAYFPAATLPAFLRPISVVLPTRMAIDGLRFAVTGGSWWPAALSLALFAAILLPGAVLLFMCAISRAIRKGVLTRG